MLQKPKCPIIALEEHYADDELVATYTGLDVNPVPAIVSRLTGCVLRYFRTAPAKSPMSRRASSGNWYRSATTFSEVLPVAAATC